MAIIRKPPKVEQGEVKILSSQRSRKLWLGSEGPSPASYCSACTCHWLKARRAACFAVEDIDLTGGTLRVERSVEETKSGLRIKPPKTKRGRRNITLPPEAVAMLREHKLRQMELRLALGQGGQPTLLFSSIEGELLSPNGVSRSWRQTCKSRKLPRVQFHALRHTHVSTLIRAGVDILTISRRIGHSEASITLDVYGHLIVGADAAAAKAIEGVLK